MPSKQKLQLKSSKTRLLPSRSGVLIEFKSGVFICNSCAISGWKLNFSPSWGVVKIDVDWMISGWFLDDFWIISEYIYVWTHIWKKFFFLLKFENFQQFIIGQQYYTSLTKSNYDSIFEFLKKNDLVSVAVFFLFICAHKRTSSTVFIDFFWT